MKRVTWFLGGALVGAIGADAAKKKVKTTAASLSPAAVAKKTGARLRGAAVEGGRALRARELEFRARRDGRATPLTDAFDDIETVMVDGKPVEPGKVVVLRNSAPARGRRRA